MDIVYLLWASNQNKLMVSVMGVWLWHTIIYSFVSEILLYLAVTFQCHQGPWLNGGGGVSSFTPEKNKIEKNRKTFLFFGISEVHLNTNSVNVKINFFNICNRMVSSTINNKCDEW